MRNASAPFVRLRASGGGGEHWGNGRGGGRKVIAEPAEGEAGGLGDAHDVPEAGDGVTEGVEGAFRVGLDAGGGGEEDAGGADGAGRGATGNDDAVADAAGGLVAATGDDGEAL